MLDEDTVEIIKRKDQNKGIMYKMGFDQEQVFERVIINRKEQSVAIDRMDMNWLNNEAFIGLRDMFTPSRRHDNAVDFVRYHFWIITLTKFFRQLWTHAPAWRYRYVLRKEETALD